MDGWAGSIFPDYGTELVCLVHTLSPWKRKEKQTIFFSSQTWIWVPASSKETYFHVFSSAAFHNFCNTLFLANMDLGSGFFHRNLLPCFFFCCVTQHMFSCKNGYHIGLGLNLIKVLKTEHVPMMCQCRHEPSNSDPINLKTGYWKPKTQLRHGPIRAKNAINVEFYNLGLFFGLIRQSNSVPKQVLLRQQSFCIVNIYLKQYFLDNVMIFNFKML